MRLISATEIGLALIFLGRSLTRVYFLRAIDRFGMVDAVALAREPGTGVVPAWVSALLLSGWVITPIAGCMLLLS